MAVEGGEILKEGWLEKESAVIRAYRKRWMVLTPDRLYSFKGEMQYTDPTEEMDLRQCDTVKSADDLTNRPFSFTVQVSERNYFLAAMSDADRDEWVAAIGRATEKPQAVETGPSPPEQPSSKPPWQLLKLATHTHRAGWGLAVCLLAVVLTLSAVTQAGRMVVAEGGRLYGPLITAGDAAVLSAQGVLRQCKEEKRCAAAQEQLSRLTPSQRRKLGSLGGWDRYHFVGRSYHTDERSGETPGAPAAGRRVRASDEPLNAVYFRY